MIIATVTVAFKKDHGKVLPF